MKIYTYIFAFISILLSSSVSSDTADLDDIKLYDIVKVEQCLDQAYVRIPGHARKLEFKIDVDAKTGDIEEASFEIYEIGMEEE